MKWATCLVLGACLWAARASAQGCIDNCGSTRCSALDSCQAAYERCFADAGGDPILEAACLQQRDACQAAAANAYVLCDRSCCSQGCSDNPCAFSCSHGFGLNFTRCDDQYSACLESGGNPTVCLSLRTSCIQTASNSYDACLQGCATPCVPIPVEQWTWGMIKLLYRD